MYKSNDKVIRKICVVTAGRADYIRVKTALRAIHEHPALELQLIVMGSHLLDRYGGTVREIEEDGLPIAEKIFMIIDGETPLTMTKSVGLGIIELATALNNLQSDIVMSLTDRFEALITATTAALMNFPVVHLQGGEVTGTIDESIRHACTKFSNFHFVATEQSKQRVIKLGELSEHVFNFGCPSIDLLKNVPIIDREELFKRVRAMTKEKRLLNSEEPFLLVLQHPVTTEYEQSSHNILQTLKAVQKTGIQTVFIWPNVDAGSSEMVSTIRRFMLEVDDHRFFTYKHFTYDLFVNLMYHTHCMVGNSSASIRETPYLGTPVVNVGTREKGRERGKNVMDVFYDLDSILEAINKQVGHGRYPVEAPYGDGNSGSKIADALARIEIKTVQKTITY